MDFNDLSSEKNGKAAVRECVAAILKPEDIIVPNSGNGKTGEDPWPECRPLPSGLEPVPLLPSEMIPEPLRPWLVDIAKRSCVPLECATVSALVSISSLVARKMGVRPEEEDAWIVSPNLWGGAVLPPSMLKSYLIEAGTIPIKSLARKARAEYNETKEKADIERAIIDAQLASEKRRKDGPRREEMETLLQSLRDCETPMTRYYTNDCTVEKLGEMAMNNPCILYVADELSRLLRGFDKQGREGDREFFLEAWNGIDSYDTDRIARGDIHIPRLCVAILGSIQPGKFARYIREAVDGWSGADGLLQRVQLLVWPDSLGEWKRCATPTDPRTSDNASLVYERIDALAVDDLPNDGSHGIPFVRFSADAQKLFGHWRDDLEHRLRGSELREYPAFGAHLGKYRSLMPSLALIFEVIDYVSGDPSVTSVTPAFQINIKNTKLAAAWCEYLEAHARKVYAVELRKEVASALSLASKIKAGVVEHGMPMRAIYRSHWESLQTPEDVARGLSALSTLGWIRIVSEDTAGRSKKIVHLHPSLRKGAD